MDRRYGWKRDRLDPRDLKYSWAPSPKLGPLPNEFDKRHLRPEVFDQSSLGSCVGNGASRNNRIARETLGMSDFVASRLFIYYQAREDDHTVDQDSGTTIREGVKVIANYGAPPESMWPYEISRFRDKPPVDVYQEAEKHQAIIYRRVPKDIDSIRSVIASGLTVVFGFTVFDSFESSEVAKTGMVKMPDIEKEQMLGGHCSNMEAYNHSAEVIGVANSWGSKWGDGGYFWLPYKFIESPSFCADLWTIQMVEE